MAMCSFGTGPQSSPTWRSPKMLLGPPVPSLSEMFRAPSMFPAPSVPSLPEAPPARRKWINPQRNHQDWAAAWINAGSGDVLCPPVVDGFAHPGTVDGQPLLSILNSPCASIAANPRSSSSSCKPGTIKRKWKDPLAVTESDGPQGCTSCGNAAGSSSSAVNTTVQSWGTAGNTTGWPDPHAKPEMDAWQNSRVCPPGRRRADYERSFQRFIDMWHTLQESTGGSSGKSDYADSTMLPESDDDCSDFKEEEEGEREDLDKLPATQLHCARSSTEAQVLQSLQEQLQNVVTAYTWASPAETLNFRDELLLVFKEHIQRITPSHNGVCLGQSERPWEGPSEAVAEVQLASEEVCCLRKQLLATESAWAACHEQERRLVEQAGEARECAEQEVRTLREESRQSFTMAHHFEARFEKLQDAHVSLGDAHVSSEEARHALQVQVAELENRLRGHTLQRGHAETLQGELEELQSKVGELEEALRQSTIERGRLSHENLAYRDKMVQFELMLSEARVSHENTNLALLSHRLQLHELTNEVAAENAVAESTAHEHVKRSSHIDQLLQTLASCELAEADHIEQHNAHRQQIGRLEQELNESKIECQQLAHSNAELCRDVAQLHMRLGVPEDVVPKGSGRMSSEAGRVHEPQYAPGEPSDPTASIDSRRSSSQNPLPDSLASELANALGTAEHNPGMCSHSLSTETHRRAHVNRSEVPVPGMPGMPWIAPPEAGSHHQGSAGFAPIQKMAPQDVPEPRAAPHGPDINLAPSERSPASTRGSEPLPWMAPPETDSHDHRWMGLAPNLDEIPNPRIAPLEAGSHQRTAPLEAGSHQRGAASNLIQQVAPQDIPQLGTSPLEDVGLDVNLAPSERSPASTRGSDPVPWMAPPETGNGLAPNLDEIPDPRMAPPEAVVYHQRSAGFNPVQRVVPEDVPELRMAPPEAGGPEADLAPSERSSQCTKSSEPAPWMAPPETGGHDHRGSALAPNLNEIPDPRMAPPEANVRHQRSDGVNPIYHVAHQDVPELGMAPPEACGAEIDLAPSERSSRCTRSSEPMPWMAPPEAGSHDDGRTGLAPHPDDIPDPRIAPPERGSQHQRSGGFAPIPPVAPHGIPESGIAPLEVVGLDVNLAPSERSLDSTRGSETVPRMAPPELYSDRRGIGLAPYVDLIPNPRIAPLESGGHHQRSAGFDPTQQVVPQMAHLNVPELGMAPFEVGGSDVNLAPSERSPASTRGSEPLPWMAPPETGSGLAPNLDEIPDPRMAPPEAGIHHERSAGFTPSQDVAPQEVPQRDVAPQEVPQRGMAPPEASGPEADLAPSERSSQSTRGSEPVPWMAPPETGGHDHKGGALAPNLDEIPDPRMAPPEAGVDHQRSAGLNPLQRLVPHDVPELRMAPPEAGGPEADLAPSERSPQSTRGSEPVPWMAPPEAGGHDHRGNGTAPNLDEIPDPRMAPPEARGHHRSSAGFSSGQQVARRDVPDLGAAPLEVHGADINLAPSERSLQSTRSSEPVPWMAPPESGNNDHRGTGFAPNPLVAPHEIPDPQARDQCMVFHDMSDLRRAPLEAGSHYYKGRDPEVNLAPRGIPLPLRFDWATRRQRQSAPSESDLSEAKEEVDDDAPSNSRAVSPEPHWAPPEYRAANWKG